MSIGKIQFIHNQNGREGDKLVQSSTLYIPFDYNQGQNVQLKLANFIHRDIESIVMVEFNTEQNLPDETEFFGNPPLFPEQHNNFQDSLIVTIVVGPQRLQKEKYEEEYPYSEEIRVYRLKIDQSVGELNELYLSSPPITLNTYKRNDRSRWGAAN
jgi:hypothetical protein